MTAPKITAVRLTDDELLKLDGLCSDDVQAEVDAARHRINARYDYPDLAPRIAGLIADVTTEAQQEGRLRFHRERIRYCPLCERSAGHVAYKSGPRRGKPNYDRPRTFLGYEFAHRFVTVQHHVRLGGCTDCVDPVLDRIVEALRPVRAELPDRLVADGAARWKRHPRRRCTACGWTGHEGEMRRRTTLLADGTYPAGCPACSAENLPLGGKPIELDDGYEVVPVFLTSVTP